MTNNAEAAINLRIPSDWLRKIDNAVEQRPVKISRHSWIMEAIHHQLQRESVEGALDIFWENSEERTSEPRYRLIFCRYAGFKGGAMQPNRILGDTPLKRHLIELGLDSQIWLKRVKAERSVPIPNVMMPLRYLAAYGYETSK